MDPNSFLYKRTYDIHNKTSVVETVYVDLNNHLASKNDAFPSHTHKKICVCSWNFLVLFDSGYQSSLPKDNPNGLKPDREEDVFHYFYDVTVILHPRFA